MFGDKPSIADLSLAQELTSLEGIKYPLKEKFPSIYEWMYVNMMQIPGFEQVHTQGAKKLTYIIKTLEKRNSMERSKSAESHANPTSMEIPPGVKDEIFGGSSRLSHLLTSLNKGHKTEL